MLPVVSFSQVRYPDIKKRIFEFKPNENLALSYFMEIRGDYADEYNPFTIKDLYRQFANINEARIDEILRFIKQFGHIGVYDDKAKPYAEKYIYWCQEINQMRKAVLLSELYSSVNIQLTIRAKENQIKKLEKGLLFEYLRSDKKNHGKCCLSTRDIECTNCGQCEALIKSMPQISEEEKTKQEAYDLRIACLFDLQEIFKSKIGQMSFTPYIDVDGNNKPRFISDLSFDSLISVMYWQLYMDFFENERFFTCEKCFGLFPYSSKKTSFICERCLGQKKSKERLNNPKKYAHDKFFRKTLYYVTDSGVSQCWAIDEEQRETLKILRDKLKENSLHKMKTMGEKGYFKWLKEQEDLFMRKVNKLKEE